MSHLIEQSQILRQVRDALQNQDFETATVYLQRAADLAAEHGDTGLQGRHLGNLALIYHRLNKPDKALECFEVALLRAREEGDRLTEDGLLGNMGNILRELGRHDDAIRFLNQALLIAQEIGDVRGRGIWLGNLGLVHDDLKAYEQAIQLHAQSVEIARQLNDRRGLAQRLGNLGNSYMAARDFPNALKYYLESVAIYEELGDKQGLALRLGIIGNIYAEIGRQSKPLPGSEELLQSALDYYQLTMSYARELGDHNSEAELLRSIGNVLATMEHYDQAIGHYNTAQQLFAALNLHEQAEQVGRQIERVLRYSQRQSSK